MDVFAHLFSRRGHDIGLGGRFFRIRSHFRTGRGEFLGRASQSGSNFSNFRDAYLQLFSLFTLTFFSKNLLLLFLGNVRGKFNHLVGLAVGIQDGIVGGLNPHLFPPFTHPHVHPGIELAPIQLGPEGLVLRAGGIGRIAEHPMVLALNLREVITQGREEVFVGRDDGAVQVEIDGGLGLFNGVHLGFVFQRVVPLRRDIHGKLDDFGYVPIGIEHRVIGGPKPQLFSPFGQSHVDPGIELAPIHLGPEGWVLRAGGIGRIAEHPVVLALNFGQCIPQGFQEIVIGGQHGAIQAEFDDRLSFIDSVHEAF